MTNFSTEHIYSRICKIAAQKHWLRHLGYLATGWLMAIGLGPKLATSQSTSGKAVIGSFVLAPLVLIVIGIVIAQISPVLTILGPLTLENAIIGVIFLINLDRYLKGRKAIITFTEI